MHMCMCLEGKYECVHVYTINVPVCASVWGVVRVGHEGLALNAKSATWSQIGPQPGFISLLHLGMNGIKPNPVYRHPSRSILNCI